MNRYYNIIDFIPYAVFNFPMTIFITANLYLIPFHPVSHNPSHIPIINLFSIYEFVSVSEICYLADFKGIIFRVCVKYHTYLGVVAQLLSDFSKEITCSKLLRTTKANILS